MALSLNANEVFNLDNPIYEYYLPKGEPRTMANQAVAAAQSLVTNWLNNGGTIWDMQTNPYSEHPCQSCADWLYQYFDDAADQYIDFMNRQSFAGRPELYTEVADYDSEDAWLEDSEAYGFEDGEIDLRSEQDNVKKYNELLTDLLNAVLDYGVMRTLDSIPATGSIDNCQGPVYEAAMAYQG